MPGQMKRVYDAQLISRREEQSTLVDTSVVTGQSIRAATSVISPGQPCLARVSLRHN